MSKYIKEYYEKLDYYLDNGGMAVYEETEKLFLFSLLCKKYGYEIGIYCDSISDRVRLCIRYLKNKEIECKFIVSESIQDVSEIDTIKIIRKCNLKDEKICNKHTFIVIVNARSNNINYRIKRKINSIFFLGRYGYCFCGYSKNFGLKFEYWRCAEFLNYALESREKLKWLLSKFYDEESRTTLVEIVRALVCNDKYSLHEHMPSEKYWGGCYRMLDDECWCNCGSATGDTILQYLNNNFSFKQIYAFEADKKSFQTMEKTFAYLPIEDRKKIEIIKKYLGNENDTFNFDIFFNTRKVTLINMDIEGAEMSVLKGAVKVISAQRPVLAICAYHNASDMVNIVELIDKCTYDYCYFLRKYKGFDLNGFNEYVVYAVPEERVTSD